MITEETIARVKSSLQATKSFTALEVIEELEKENEELKADKKYLDNINNEQTEIILQLNEQIEQLSNDNHVLKTAFITQQEQIEKMKCCGNCKHHYWNYGELDCRLNCSSDINCSKWELKV